MPYSGHPNPDHIEVIPSDVLCSADYLETLGVRAAAERRSLSIELAGTTRAWLDGAKPGFTEFIGMLQRQADRMATETSDVSGKLRDAARAYYANEQSSVEQLRAIPPEL